MLKVYYLISSLLFSAHALSQSSLDKVSTNFKKLESSLKLKKVNEVTYKSDNSLGQFTILKTIKGPSKVSLQVKDQSLLKEITKEKLVLLHSENSKTNILRNFILGNPAKGRIYHFKTPEKISKVVWIKPWKEEKERGSFKSVLTNMSSTILKKVE